MKQSCGIYKITSPSGKVYVGQSRGIEQRWRNHCSSKHCRHLHNSIKKYGKENHSFEIIHELPYDVEQIVLNEYEALYMQLYKDCGVILMNSKSAGANGKMSEEAKKKISESLKGRDLPHKKRPQSEESKRKRSVALKGFKHTGEALEKIRANQKKATAAAKAKPNWRKGIKLPLWHIELMRKISIGRKLSPESITKRTETRRSNGWNKRSR